MGEWVDICSCKMDHPSEGIPLALNTAPRAVKKTTRRRRMSALDYTAESKKARQVMGGNVPLLRAPIVEDLYDLSLSRSQAKGGTIAAAMAEEAAEEEHHQSVMNVATEAVQTALQGHELYVEAIFEGMDSTSPIRQRCRRLIMSRYWHAMMIVAICTQLAMVLVEPGWAPDPQPDFSSWQLSPVLLTIIEAALLVLYIIEGSLRVAVLRWQVFKTRRYYLVFAGTVAALCVDLALFVTWHQQYKWRLARCLRPILLVTRVRGLRRPLWVMVRTTLAVTQIGLFGSVIVLFYSVLGMQLFNTAQVPGYGPNPDGPILPNDPSKLNDVNGNFDNILEALLATYTATTTESYPGVLYPALQLRPIVASIYFISFMSVSIYIIMPLIIAVVYDMYRDVHKQQVAKRRNAEHSALHFAYHALIPNPDQAVMGFDVFSELLNRVNSRYSAETRLAIFRTLAGLDGDDGISLTEFLGLAYVLRFRWSLYQPDGGSGQIGSSSPRVSVRRMSAQLLQQQQQQQQSQDPSQNTQSHSAGVHLASASSSSTSTPTVSRGGSGSPTEEPLLNRVGEDAAAASGNARGVGMEYRDMPARSRSGGGSGVMGHGRSESVATQNYVDAALIPPGVLYCCLPCVWRRGARSCPSVCECLWIVHRALSCRFGSRRTLGARVAATIVAANWFKFAARVAVWGNVVTACCWTVGWQRAFNACDKEHLPAPTWVACFDEPIYIVQTLTVVFSALGVLEMTVKLYGYGVPRFVSNWWNGADLFIVLITAFSSLVMWVYPREYLTDTTNANLSDLFEIGRALRVMRVITLEPQFRAVFESIVDCFSALLHFSVLMWCVGYSFAIIGMVLFGDVPKETMSDLENQRYRFDSFLSASLALFQMCTENNWNSIMYVW